MRIPRRKTSRRPQPSTALRIAPDSDATAAAIVRLPVHRGSETWDVALAKMPSTFRVGNGPPFRPVAAICAGSEGGIAISEPMHPDALKPTCLLEVMARFAMEPLLPGARPLGYLPAHVRMRAGEDPSTVRLKEVLASTGVAVQQTDDLTHFLAALEYINECEAAEEEDEEDEEDEEGEEFEEFEDDEDDEGPLLMPGLMAAKGMTIDRVRGCAEAMALFCAAAPWRTLADEVLWCVQPEPTTRGLRRCVVTGALGEQFGLGFVPSMEEFAARHRQTMPGTAGERYRPDTTLWSVMLEPVNSAPEEDVELWRRARLPFCEFPAMAAEESDGADAKAATVQAIPLPVGVTVDGRAIRPTPAQLLLMEGLLRGFAAADPSNLRRDMIRFAVKSSGGRQTITVRRA